MIFQYLRPITAPAVGGRSDLPAFRPWLRPTAAGASRQDNGSRGFRVPRSRTRNPRTPHPAEQAAWRRYNVGLFREPHALLRRYGALSEFARNGWKQTAHQSGGTPPLTPPNHPAMLAPMTRRLPSSESGLPVLPFAQRSRRMVSGFHPTSIRF